MREFEAELKFDSFASFDFSSLLFESPNTDLHPLYLSKEIMIGGNYYTVELNFTPSDSMDDYELYLTPKGKDGYAQVTIKIILSGEEKNHHDVETGVSHLKGRDNEDCLARKVYESCACTLDALARRYGKDLKHVAKYRSKLPHSAWLKIFKPIFEKYRYQPNTDKTEWEKIYRIESSDT